MYTSLGGARPGVKPVTIIVTDGWATPSDRDSVVDLADEARQRINSLEVYVVGVGDTARWNVRNIEGMAGSSSRVSYVGSEAAINSTVNSILDELC